MFLEGSSSIQEWLKERRKESWGRWIDIFKIKCHYFPANILTSWMCALLTLSNLRLNSEGWSFAAFGGWCHFRPMIWVLWWEERGIRLYLLWRRWRGGRLERSHGWKSIGICSESAGKWIVEPATHRRIFDYPSILQAQKGTREVRAFPDIRSVRS